MKNFVLFTALMFSFVLISCGNDVNTVKNDNEQTNDESVNDDSVNDDEAADEAADETTDEINDETIDEITDEVADETTDETTDTDDSGECTDISVKYDKTGLENVATDISLEVRSNGWGTLLDTLTMETEGSIKLEVSEEDPYDGTTPSYFIYETADGFFTNTDYAVFGDTINVDLDPAMPDHVNGSIYMVQHYFGPTALSSTDIKVTDSDGKTAGCFTTDSNGRFVIDLADGDYVFSFKDMDMSEYDHEVTVDSNYLDLRIEAEAQMAKPNIYIYPEETVELDVSLEFPLGGTVTTSIPDYGTGWHVTVTPDGMIDGKYGYLFYESQNPDVFQYKYGWTVKNSGLEGFFRSNLSAYGFAGKEIEDFIEWWIPRLDAGCYDIYPQTAKEIDPVVKLNFSMIPDSLQRLSYAVKEAPACKEHLAEPVIEPFERTGFSILEWGVTIR